MPTETVPRPAGIVLELLVSNHPGVMAHITGLFARRAFNLEGILCGPVGGDRSRMWLLVNDDAKLEQIVKQLAKLHDVMSVGERAGADVTLFHRLEAALCPGGGRPA